jgi:hypothetical protein
MELINNEFLRKTFFSLKDAEDNFLQSFLEEPNDHKLIVRS